MGPKESENPTVNQRRDNTDNPKRHWVIMETVFLEQRSSALKRANPGVMANTKDVATSIQAVSPLLIIPAGNGMEEGEVEMASVLVIPNTAPRISSVVLSLGGVGLSDESGVSSPLTDTEVSFWNDFRIAGGVKDIFGPFVSNLRAFMDGCKMGLGIPNASTTGREKLRVPSTLARIAR